MSRVLIAGETISPPLVPQATIPMEQAHPASPSVPRCWGSAGVSGAQPFILEHGLEDRKVISTAKIIAVTKTVFRGGI